MLKHPRDVNYCTHDPRHHSSFIPVIIMGDKGGYCFILRQFIIFFILLSFFLFLKDEDFFLFKYIDAFPKRFEVKNASEV